MKASFQLLFCTAAFLALPGCLFVPRTKYNVSQAENRALSEQNRAQLTEIENLKKHSRSLEDRVIRSEKQLALLQERSRLDQCQLDAFQREREGLYEQFDGLAYTRGRMPPELSRSLVELSKRYPSLQFDPETGVSKLDTDILFDTGKAELKPEAAQLIDELVRVMKSPAAGELKIMVAGHTDDRQIAGREVRDQYPNNFHLSAARALAVADRMKKAGLPEHRLAVAGFGPCQPIAPNDSATNRQLNRRVEIFVATPESPMLGWSDSTPSVYGKGLKR